MLRFLRVYIHFNHPVNKYIFCLFWVNPSCSRASFCADVSKQQSHDGCHGADLTWTHQGAEGLGLLSVSTRLWGDPKRLFWPGLEEASQSKGSDGPTPACQHCRPRNSDYSQMILRDATSTQLPCRRLLHCDLWSRLWGCSRRGSRWLCGSFSLARDAFCGVVCSGLSDEAWLKMGCELHT